MNMLHSRWAVSRRGRSPAKARLVMMIMMMMMMIMMMIVLDFMMTAHCWWWWCTADVRRSMTLADSK